MLMMIPFWRYILGLVDASKLRVRLGYVGAKTTPVKLAFKTIARTFTFHSNLVVYRHHSARNVTQCSNNLKKT